MSRLKNWEDNASWRVFFETHWRLIYNFSLRKGFTHEEAREAVQETVVAVAKTLGVTVGHVYVAKRRVSKLTRKEIEALEAKGV